MKKIMFALLAAACSSLMAEVLVYDYAASFKRLDVTAPVKVKYAGSTYKMDTAKVASDKFTGYVVIDACEECTGAMVASAEPGYTTPGNYAVVYIRRAGSKKLTYNKNAVYRAIGRFYAAKFGAKSGIGLVSDTQKIHVNPTKYTDALGVLSFWIDADGKVDSKAHTGTPGFMGVDHTGKAFWLDGDETTPGEYANWWKQITAHNPLLAVDYDTVDNAGYGKLISLKQIVAQSCFADVTSVCWAVKNLSGSIVGGFNYTGICNNPIYDLCLMADKGIDGNLLPAEAHMAPIAGTFTMKLNNALSFYKKEFALANYKAAENAVLKKFNVTKVYGNATETDTFNADMKAKYAALEKPLTWADIDAPLAW